MHECTVPTIRSNQGKWLHVCLIECGTPSPERLFASYQLSQLSTISYQLPGIRVSGIRSQYQTTRSQSSRADCLQIPRVASTYLTCDALFVCTTTNNASLYMQRCMYYICVLYYESLYLIIFLRPSSNPSRQFWNPPTTSVSSFFPQPTMRHYQRCMYYICMCL